MKIILILSIFLISFVAFFGSKINNAVISKNNAHKLEQAAFERYLKNKYNE